MASPRFMFEEILFPPLLLHSPLFPLCLRSLPFCAALPPVSLFPPPGSSFVYNPLATVFPPSFSILAPVSCLLTPSLVSLPFPLRLQPFPPSNHAFLPSQPWFPSLCLCLLSSPPSSPSSSLPPDPCPFLSSLSPPLPPVSCLSFVIFQCISPSIGLVISCLSS